MPLPKPVPGLRQAPVRALAHWTGRLAAILALCAGALIGAAAEEHRSARPGPYGVGSTWAGGTVPPSGSAIVIAHAVTAPMVTVAQGTTLTIAADGALTVQSGITISGGTLVNGGGTIAIGPPGGGNRTLLLKSGALTLAGGTTTVNGSVGLVAGVFTMSAGDLAIDPNGGREETSVAPGRDVLAVASAVTSAVSGGTITIVDPPFAGPGRALAYSGAKGDSRWMGSTLVFGGDSGTSALSAQATGFLIDTCASGAGWLQLGHVIANGQGAGRAVIGPADPRHGFDVGGDLTIRTGATVVTTPAGAPLRISGNIANHGTLSDGAGLRFGQRSGPNTVAQTVTGAQRNFVNPALPAAPGCFAALTIDNTSTPIAVAFAIGNLYVTGNVDFRNGAIDIDQHHLYFMDGSSATRTNGFLVSSGRLGQMARQFPPGPSSFTYHLADGTGGPDYSPVTIQLTQNSESRFLGIRVFDVAHPSATQPDHLTRYWLVNGERSGSFAGVATCAFTGDDLVGRLEALLPATWTGSAWTRPKGRVTAGSITCEIDSRALIGATAMDLTASGP